MKFYLMLVLCCLSLYAHSQATIYVAPAPKDYWQQKREDANNKLLYQMMLNDQLKVNADNVRNEAQKCMNDVRGYYANLSDYPSITSGVHEVHVLDGDMACQRTKASVSSKGTINWIGNGTFYDVKSSDIIKNAKTKIVLDVNGKSYFYDVFFIYEK